MIRLVQPTDSTSAAPESAAGEPDVGSAHVSLLIVDDHRVVAEGLAALLSDYPGITVKGWVESAADAIAIADAEPVDVVIVDARLANEPWSRAAATIRVSHPHTEVVIINASETDDMVLDAIEAGVSGYVGKSASVTEVAAAVRRAGSERALLPASTLAAVLARQRSEGQMRSERVRLFRLFTPREHEVLGLMARGMSNRAMAAELGISYSTVRSHVRGVLEKLGTHSRLEAVALANRLGLFEDGGPS